MAKKKKKIQTTSGYKRGAVGVRRLMGENERETLARFYDLTDQAKIEADSIPPIVKEIIARCVVENFNECEGYAFQRACVLFIRALYDVLNVKKKDAHEVFQWLLDEYQCSISGNLDMDDNIRYIKEQVGIEMDVPEDAREYFRVMTAWYKFANKGLKVVH